MILVSTQDRQTVAYAHHVIQTWTLPQTAAERDLIPLEALHAAVARVQAARDPFHPTTTTIPAQAATQAPNPAEDPAHHLQVPSPAMMAHATTLQTDPAVNLDDALVHR
jgi:hypothetical protein